MEKQKKGNQFATSNGVDANSAEVTLAAALDCSVCPVCFETLTPPLYQCVNGHILCNNCSKQVELCAECRVPISKTTKIRNIALEKILNNLRVDCSNKPEGCALQVTVEWLNRHLQVCPFTPFDFCSKQLGSKTCTYQANDISVLPHLETIHEITKVNSKTFRLCLNFQKIPMGQSEFLFEPFVVMSLKVPVLIRSVVSADGYFTFTGLALITDTEGLHNIRLKFRIESQVKKVSFEWRGYVNPYRTFKDATMNNSFRIPVVSVLEFWEPNASLPQGITAIVLYVDVWETSSLTQDDRVQDEVHIFEQNVTEPVPSCCKQDSPATSTVDRIQTEDLVRSDSQLSEGDVLTIFSSPLEYDDEDVPSDIELDWDEDVPAMLSASIGDTYNFDP